jgi:hypothetical protein
LNPEASTQARVGHTNAKSATPDQNPTRGVARPLYMTLRLLDSCAEYYNWSGRNTSLLHSSGASMGVAPTVQRQDVSRHEAQRPSNTDFGLLIMSLGFVVAVEIASALDPLLVRLQRFYKAARSGKRTTHQRSRSAVSAARSGGHVHHAKAEPQSGHVSVKALNFRGANPVVTIQREPYIRWLELKKVPLFEGGGIFWRLDHNKCLLPASLKPMPVELDAQTARDLLRRSGAPLLRYFGTTFEQPTAFWYLECTAYAPQLLSKDTRRQIRQGRERCEIRQIDPEWLARNGYPCYLSAFTRYKRTAPESLADFQDQCLESAGGPFEYWGAFVDGKLRGFLKCILGDDYMACSVLKLDPAFLNMRTTYALKDVVLTRYVTEQSKKSYDGFRPMTHETNVHDFLLRFGYQKKYCDLQIRYRPSVAALVKALYPFRSALANAQELPVARQAHALLRQEHIRRSFV